MMAGKSLGGHPSADGGDKWPPDGGVPGGSGSRDRWLPIGVPGRSTPLLSIRVQGAKVRHGAERGDDPGRNQ
jgi:hypothetical protein